MAEKTASNELLGEYCDNLLGVFGTPQLVVESASGSKVTDVDGKVYIDFLGGIAVNCLGHSNDELVGELTKQAKKIWHSSNFFTSKPAINLAATLNNFVKNSFSQSTKNSENLNPHVFFANSGTEANEAALKLVKKWGNSSEFAKLTSATKPARIIALTHSFHGRTLGALSLTSKAIYRDPFSPLIENVEFIEANNLESLEDCFSDLAYSSRGPVAGMFLEVIQGEAGVVPLSAQFLARARHLTAGRSALLVIDEVQTGMGRTGTWFACANPLLTASSPIIPDVLTLAKSLGAGFPIGAMISVTDRANSVFEPGNHGTTFGGNPLACSVALRAISIIERDSLLENAQNIAKIVAKEVISWNMSKISEVRGAGALLAIEFQTERAQELQKRCMENGLIVNAVNPRSLRLAPALNISEEDLKFGLQILKKSIQN